MVTAGYGTLCFPMRQRLSGMMITMRMVVVDDELGEHLS